MGNVFLDNQISNMPRRPLPPYQVREQWITVISASFHQLTIWRTTRDLYVHMKSLMVRLEIGIEKLKRILEAFWFRQRVLAFWGQILAALAHLTRISRKVMNWLEHRHWRNQEQRHEKELVIKLLVVSVYYTTMLEQIFKGSFERLLESFRNHKPVHGLNNRGRRWSYGEGHGYPSELLQNRCKYEKLLASYSCVVEQRLEWKVQETHRLYDNSEIFQNFVCHIQRRHKEQEDWYAIWRVRYSYPTCRLKDIGDRTSVLWRDNAPENGVPTWNEDEDLKAIFP